jgi:hypothetical protein
MATLGRRDGDLSPLTPFVALMNIAGGFVRS